jgi:hypothetical protein
MENILPYLNRPFYMKTNASIISAKDCNKGKRKFFIWTTTKLDLIYSVNLVPHYNRN